MAQGVSYQGGLVLMALRPAVRHGWLWPRWRSAGSHGSGRGRAPEGSPRSRGYPRKATGVRGVAGTRLERAQGGGGCYDCDGSDDAGHGRAC